MNIGAIWKSQRLIGTIATLLALIAFSLQIPSLKSIDHLLYDISLRANTLQADSRITLIEVDGQQSQASVATAIEKLSDAGAKLIALDMLYSESEPASGVQPDETQLDPLAENVRLAGNVLLPLYFEFGSEARQGNLLLPNYITRSAIRQINQSSDDASPDSAFLLSHPYNSLSEGAFGFGHFNLIADSDGTVRSLPLIVEFAGQYYPSIALTLAAGVMNIPSGDLRINIGKDIELGPLNIITNRSSHIYTAFHPDSGSDSYDHYKLSELFSATTPASLFEDKIILIGSSAEGKPNSFATPLKEQMSRTEFIAHSLQSILKEEYVVRPAWGAYLEFMLLLIAGLYLSLLLPRVSPVAGMALTAMLVLAVTMAGFLLISEFSIWIQTGLATLLLIAGNIAVGIRQYLAVKEKKPTPASNPNATNKALGLSFLSQGMLEEAFAKFLACPLDEEMLSILYDLGNAFERKRQFQMAIDVYQHMGSQNSEFRDIQARIINATNAIENISEKGANDGISSLLASGEVTTLGRYEIISELGKGAMGTVYLGRDPQINRQVAIKTLALSKEFEPNQLKEVKERFFHEAEIAGMLNHPNIVTIFDAGAEHDLAYIAMEYLDGVNLTGYTKKGSTLPLTTTLKIVGKVAEALQYAHSHGVIHRDIKPANIMILKNKSVKVTDFGIAHISESGKTKAGIVLGTPSYMSPEQLSGKKIDGRSDLFSLGVMLYEMVTGVRPFLAESISKLMFKIAKSSHLDVRKLNPELPEGVAELINRLLSKQPEERPATAKEVLDAIHQCLQGSEPRQ
ncbi:serine/threonine protein kinase [Mariprofundus ferrinatatus]|uniref:non-specific serine/threonine protein kinase n=1 Tax=Mariprofundus ferrinatatus TaxID=1921087 RepID=A0A2K8L2I0_9PROT|nr:serine/threonine-protein kinase [Mariprofundus ferrinatatus]ATX81453.1 serine/threonine protein kinase [Mariprofundus ferrinatatus]